MTVTGHVENGKIVLDGDVILPEGYGWRFRW